MNRLDRAKAYGVAWLSEEDLRLLLDAVAVLEQLGMNANCGSDARVARAALAPLLEDWDSNPTAHDGT